MLIYSFGLREIALFLGVLYLVAHLLPLIKPFFFQDLLQKLPRSAMAGYVATTIATLWAVSLLDTMSLGEYNKFRTIFTIMCSIGGLLCYFFVRDFLSLRALGILLLLGANVILDGAFLSNNPYKIPLVCNAYAWIILGMILVSSPYLIRNAIQWATAELHRWQFLMSLGVVWGFIVLGLGIFVL